MSKNPRAVHFDDGTFKNKSWPYCNQRGRGGGRDVIYTGEPALTTCKKCLTAMAEDQYPLKGKDVADQIDRDKYVTFNRKELMALLFPEERQEMTVDALRSLLRATELDDAVVIRKRDMFAPSVLYAYAGSVLTAADLLEASSASKLTVDRLRRLADYFAGEADHARQLARHLPD